MACVPISKDLLMLPCASGFLSLRGLCGINRLSALFVASDWRLVVVCVCTRFERPQPAGPKSEHRCDGEVIINCVPFCICYGRGRRCKAQNVDSCRIVLRFSNHISGVCFGESKQSSIVL